MKSDIQPNANLKNKIPEGKKEKKSSLLRTRPSPPPPATSTAYAGFSWRRPSAPRSCRATTSRSSPWPLMQPLLRPLALRSPADLFPAFVAAARAPEDDGRVEGRTSPPWLL
jgi:hypothetical protein